MSTSVSRGSWPPSSRDRRGLLNLGASAVNGPRRQKRQRRGRTDAKVAVPDYENLHSPEHRSSATYDHRKRHAGSLRDDSAITHGRRHHSLVSVTGDPNSRLSLSVHPCARGSCAAERSCVARPSDDAIVGVRPSAALPVRIDARDVLGLLVATVHLRVVAGFSQPVVPATTTEAFGKAIEISAMR